MKKYTRFYEMSRVRKFDNDWFYTRPSSSETPVVGSRQEHLPPHIELIKNNSLILKVVIPFRKPESIEDIVTTPEVTRKKKRDLLKWFNKKEYDETLDTFISAYDLSIRFWNRDNTKYKIEYTYDDEGNIVVMKFPWSKK